MQDQKIIELLRGGHDDKALVSLYRNFPAIRKMILFYGGSSADAEDVFQEALIILCRKIKNPDFRLTAQLSTYLFSVCRFLWKDELKRRKRMLPAEWESGLNSQEEESLTEITEQEQQAKLAERIFHELGDRCRELLLLFYQAGLALKDIAAKMGYNSEATAKNQKYKCLEAARNRLKEIKQTIQTF